mmetsp:Transcript_39286/g.77270  ORF Transcript_39286/g.77270 Transcript_39286/m.77270 type:complete len:377 (+) Transcript_39286:94-1224(+)|eukprot:CAMPEP_0175138880 /NCGR_PEP_ID=MMETSP0087-20121206/10590_1 /TAXON_ID=136419 /ORGANISM="Unknown Unknown, Strain D1" /LENGTH=376 /DNA_ID=CAMNT_0016421823 /DNA_START=90 /DNA_END=1220 /DNA_ORIENTATION=+
MNNLLLCTLVAVATVSAEEMQLDMKWKAVAPLPFPRSDMTATPNTQNGKTLIYVIGGCSKDQGWVEDAKMHLCPQVTDKCTVYDPAENKHKVCAPAPRPRYRHAAANVKGKIWLAGGRTLEDNLINEVDVYDPSTNTWTTPFVWANATSDLAAFADDNSLFLAGGYVYNYRSVKETWKVDTLTNKVVAVAPMLEGRGDIAAAHVDAKTVVLTGGFGADFCAPHASAEQYSITEDKWKNTADLSLGRGDKSLVSVKGKVFAIGGEKKDATCSSVPVEFVEVYDSVQDVWKIETQYPLKRFRFVAAAEEQAKAFYVFGGQTFLDSTCNCFKVASEVYSYYSYYSDYGDGLRYSAATMTAPVRAVALPAVMVGIVVGWL